MLKKIFLQKEKYLGYRTDNIVEHSLDLLNRINIFIGANNSGKSRFLRSLFSDKNFSFELTAVDLLKLSELLKQIHRDIDRIFNKNGIADSSNTNIMGVKATLSSFIDKFKKFDFPSVTPLIDDFNSFWGELLIFKNQGASHIQHFTGNVDLTMVDAVIREYVNEVNDSIKEIIPNKLSYSVERVYIPILRGLRPTQMNDDILFDELKDNYCSRTMRDYFKENELLASEIFTGLRLYQDLKKMLLGKREERNKVREFENFLSKTFFNSEQVSLTPSIDDDSVHVSIGNVERPIYEIGDGIQSIIILLYPLFFNQGSNLLVFIEEPENSIHPGLQRLFLESLMRKEFETFQYFITTHSNHFLDITLELPKVSIYTFQKKKDKKEGVDEFVIENISNQDSQVLDLIGARNSSVFLSNCTIWVEGITDRLYLKKYLEVYQNKLLEEDKIKTVFREDFNFSFVEYSGGNIVHWSFADDSGWEKIKSNRISNKIFLIADQDNTKAKPDSAKAKRLSLLHKQLGDNFKVVGGKEVENTLSPKILIETIEKLERNNFINVKYDVNKITYEKYKDCYLGKFIKLNFQNLRTRKYEAESGTLYCKLDFCKAAVELILKAEDLSNEGLSIAGAIFSFIEKCNQS
jgi:AAA15 family ATPase/GTPase